MILMQRDEETRDELNSLRRQELPPRVGDRREMVLLSAVAWSPAGIAAQLGSCAPTVGGLLKDFLDRGTAALFARRTGPPPDLPRRPQVTQIRSDWLGQDRTWTSRQLATAWAERGIALSARQVRRDLEMMEAGGRRTTHALRHQPNPVKVARAVRGLGHWKETASAGRWKLDYLDEGGLAPTLPTADSWSLPAQRPRIDSASPHGRRVNALAAYRPYDTAPRREVCTAERTWDCSDLRGLLGALPRAKVPPVVVLDNARPHTSQVVRRARRSLAAAGVYLYFLPPYAPQLNEIEPVFRQVKDQEIPQRSHTSRAALGAAVDTGFDTYGRSLKSKSEKKPRRAA